MEWVLNEIERRVLGVLMEKAMTQPDYYPMTLNAITAGCSQRSNRDPVMELDEIAVQAALDTLRQRGLVEHVLPAPGGRTDRFRHKVEARFAWSPRERAVVAELLLRGPQTVGELRTRCSRMVPFDNLEIVGNILEMLQSSDPPVVAPLPRESGHATVRYTHLFYPEGEQPAVGPPPTAVRSAAAPRATVASADVPAVGPAAAASADVTRMQMQLDDLQGELAEVITELSELRRRIEAIEGRL